MKTCSKCGEEKPESDFGFYKSGKKIGRTRSPCTSCAKIQSLNWRIKNRGYASDYWKIYYPKNAVSIKRRAVADKKRRIKFLSDSYIREVLKDQRGFAKEQITPDLISAHRALIKLKRTIKELS